MANKYYTPSGEPVDLTRARAVQLRAEFASIEQGFALVQIDTNRAVKLRNGETVEILDEPSVRAGGVFAFDSSGNLVVFGKASDTSRAGKILGWDATTGTLKYWDYASTITSPVNAAAASAASAAQSATNAAASASAAAQSATNAAASASAAAASFDAFDDRYLGAKPSDPVTDNDGNALITGALYWNTTTNEMRVWNGSSWRVVAGSLVGNIETATRLQTARTISLSGDVSGSASFDGSANVTINTSIAKPSAATYTYDAQGRVTGISETLPAGTRSTTITYDAQGRVSSVVVEHGGVTRTTSYTYDNSGAVIRFDVTEERNV